VLTFDFRIPNNDVTVTDWVDKDLAAMLVEARKPAPGLPLLFVGHSLGGQVIGVTPGNEAVRASLHVTRGSGYYKLNDRMPIRVRLLWFVFMPLFTPIFGYFPGKALRMVGDLPRGVTWQWRRWCLHPEYLLSEGDAWRAAMARFGAPVLSLSFEDDEINPKRAVDALDAVYPNVVRRHVHPRDVGQQRIGHFGFFSEKCRDPLWMEALAWLRSQAGASAEPAIPERKPQVAA
jgi:predicted alpha/beta hydrolase